MYWSVGENVEATGSQEPNPEGLLGAVQPSLTQCLQLKEHSYCE